MRIAVVGTSGTVGGALLPLLSRSHELTAVSRRGRRTPDGIRREVADARARFPVRR